MNSVCVRTQAELGRRGVSLLARHAPPDPNLVKNVNVLLPLESTTEDTLVSKLSSALGQYKAFISYPSDIPKGSVEDGAIMAYGGLILRGLLAYDMTSSRYLLRVDVYITEGMSDDELELAKGNRNSGIGTTPTVGMDEAKPSPP